ncbi:DNA-methyltransferase [Streptomyces klenkii]|uniref:DNA-methyltransferase n=1 Tax=Streptomyces klenkii TaxID=1420899 RepID=UPI0036EA3CC3
MITPYYVDDAVELYLGDCRDLLPALGLGADLVCTDPPYGETSLAWDRWPEGWPGWISSTGMWCFGSTRLFMTKGHEFTTAGWKFSHDVIWEKPNGTSFTTDRFKRVHEIATHWYRGRWADVHHETPRTSYSGPDKSASARESRMPHTGRIGAHRYVDDGTRLARSVIRGQSVRFQRRHPTEKPTEILIPLIEYGCPPGGLVLDPFAGSGATLDAARLSGRKAVGIEADERYAEAAAKRLCDPFTPSLFGGAL